MFVRSLTAVVGAGYADLCKAFLPLILMQEPEVHRAGSKEGKVNVK